MNKITFTDKEDRRTTNVPAINKITAADMNEIKSVVNAIVDKLTVVKIPKSLVITSSDFEGNAYTNTELIGKSPQIDFNLTTNSGSGTLLKYNDGYTFNAQTGTITTEAENYRLDYYKNLI